AALLADLLKEARAGRSAEHRVEERRREPPPVGSRDAEAAEAEVHLLGVLALEDRSRRCVADPDRAHADRAVRPPRERREAGLDRMYQRLVLEVPGRRHDDVRADVAR